MEVFLDKSWVNLRRIDDDYKRALDSFLDFAMVSNAVENKIACPCRICGNRKYYEREVVRNHLIMRGMDKDYQNCIWNFHGETRVGSVDYDLADAYYSEHDSSSGDGMIGMIEDGFHNNIPTTGSLGPNHASWNNCCMIVQLLQQRSILLLCQLERIFNPSFFDIMVHLIIHLAHEAKLAGPVFYRWMYPVERYLRRLKAYVRNKSRVEGSIAEGYIAEEAAIFCSRYLEGVVTMENRCTRNNDDDGGESHDGISVFSLKSRAMSRKKDLHPDSTMIERAHFYVLTNCDEVRIYADEHYSLIANQYRHASREIYDIHRRQFSSWFAQNVSSNLPRDLKKAADLRCLSQFPSMWVKTMTKVTCNGFRWRVKSIDKRSLTQNSGVCVKAATEDGEVYHFGVLTNIIELCYPEGNSVLLFDCDWVDPMKGVKKDVLGFTVVNLNTKLKSVDTFVLASQAIQVFYTPEIRDKQCHVVTITKPRDLFDMEEDIIPIVDSLVVDLSTYFHDEELENSRDDIVGVSVDPEVDMIHS